jgi:hypothetical protein
MIIFSVHILLAFFFFPTNIIKALFLGGVGTRGCWTQGFTLTKQVLYCLSHTSSTKQNSYHMNFLPETVLIFIQEIILFFLHIKYTFVASKVTEDRGKERRIMCGRIMNHACSTMNQLSTSCWWKWTKLRNTLLSHPTVLCSLVEGNSYALRLY